MHHFNLNHNNNEVESKLKNYNVKEFKANLTFLRLISKIFFRYNLHLYSEGKFKHTVKLGYNEQLGTDQICSL